MNCVSMKNVLKRIKRLHVLFHLISFCSPILVSGRQYRAGRQWPEWPGRGGLGGRGSLTGVTGPECVAGPAWQAQAGRGPPVRRVCGARRPGAHPPPGRWRLTVLTPGANRPHRPPASPASLRLVAPQPRGDNGALSHLNPRLISCREY